MGLKSFAKTVARSRTATFMVPPPLLGAKTYFGRRGGQKRSVAAEGAFFFGHRGASLLRVCTEDGWRRNARERESQPATRVT